MSLKKNSECFYEIVVGSFILVVFVVLGYFSIMISGSDIFLGSSKIPVTVIFPDVGGLKERDSVMLRGMTVGAVHDMRLENNGVEVTLLIQKAVKFKEGYTISVNTSSLLGGNYLLIEEGTGNEIAKNEIIRGKAPINWVRDLGTITSKLESSLDGDALKKLITNLEEASGSINLLTKRVEQGNGTLGKLLSDDMSLYNDLSNTVSNLRALTAKVNTGENTLSRLLNDQGGLYADARDTVANLKSISGRLEKGEGTVGKLLSADETVYRDLQESMERIKRVTIRLDKGEGTLGRLMADDNKVYNELETMVANLKLVSDRLVKGEGTLGRLTADDKLYNDVHGLILDVRQTIDNFRDTTPISAFSSLIMGGL